MQTAGNTVSAIDPRTSRATIGLRNRVIVEDQLAWHFAWGHCLPLLPAGANSPGGHTLAGYALFLGGLPVRLFADAARLAAAVEAGGGRGVSGAVRVLGW